MSARRVVVVGDMTIDWLEEIVPRSEPGQQDKLRNYQLYPGFFWTPIVGGAALLEDLVRSAIPNDHFEVMGHKRPDLDGGEARSYLQSLATVGPMLKDRDGPIRVQRFKGFSPGFGAEPDPRVAPLPEPMGEIACLALDDAANGCRWNAAFLTGLQKLAGRAALVVVKLSRPLETGALLESLKKLESHPQFVIVVNADDLRSQGVDIGRRLSWERGTADVFAASRRVPLLKNLCSLGNVIVRFGSNACLTLMQNGKNCLVYDPSGHEDTFEDSVSGKMPGATSAFVAALISGLLGPKPDELSAILKSALGASRCLIERGFSRTPESQRLSYPTNVFGSHHGAAFADVALPTDVWRDDRWSILSAVLERTPALPNLLVRHGRTVEEFRGVPTAKYGKLIYLDRREIEGYRAIENLVREYMLGMDNSGVKPLSIAVFGPPGSGKSIGVKEIAREVGRDRVETHTINLTQAEGPRDLVNAFHTARDAALRGRLPLLVFDEFDCDFGTVRWGWLKFFLAPMQDGEFKDEGLQHPLGPAIFVFTGGTSHSHKEFADHAVSDANTFAHAKGTDFVSRLKGFVNVQGINPAKVKPKRT